LTIRVEVMELIDFSQFLSRRAAQMSGRDNLAVVEAPIFDLWADLHTERPERETIVAPPTDIGPADFWDDLQFRLAYPTHRLRKH
jgi:hypothetical protein